MIKKTYDFGQFLALDEKQIKDALDGMKHLPLDELLDLAHAGADYIAGQTDAVTVMLEHTGKAIEKDRAATIKRLRELGEERARFAADVLQNEWFDFGIEKRPPTLNSVTKDDIVICGTRTYSFYIADKYKINSNRVYCDSTRIRGLSPKRVFIVNRHMFEDELLEAVLSRFTQRSEIIYITEE